MEDLLGKQPESAMRWVREMLDYNVPLGKLNRGMAVLDVCKACAGDRQLTEGEVFRANALGWCIEFLQAYFLVADDIMDKSITRRGQPCWYLQPHVGMVAINDGILLENFIFYVLKKHFSSLPCYVNLMELFHEVTLQTAHGQLLDTTTAPIGTVDLSRYTMEAYDRIVLYKTAYYTFYLPIACGMRLSGIENPESYKLAENLCLQMGRYFQIQDDVLDCFGDPEIIGKIGTDIEDNKCSWLVVTALMKATSEQKSILEKHYGKSGGEDVGTVKKVYMELDLDGVFREYEAQSHTSLVSCIEEQTLIPKEVFLPLLTKIYKRTK